MLLLPIQMYGQQQGLGTTDSNKILSEFGKSAYKMLMEGKQPIANPEAMNQQMKMGDYFDQNPLGYELDPSGLYYLDQFGEPVYRDTYNSMYNDYLRQQQELMNKVNPDQYGIGGILDKLQFYKR